MFGFIGPHWRGEGGFWRSVLLFSLALPPLFFWFIIYSQAALSLDTPPRPRMYAAIAQSLLFAGIGFWQLVGTWRASRADRPGAPNLVFRWLARLIALAGAAIAAVFLVMMPNGAAHLSSIADDTDEVGKLGYKVQVVGDRLNLDGAVTWRMHDEFIAALDSNPGIKKVHLNSLGGQTAVGHRLAAKIRERKLDTLITDKCASACTVMFGGGVRRILGRNGQLGFHSNAPTFTKDSEMSLAVRMNQDRDRVYWTALGVPDNFIKRVEATPGSEVWVPSAKELRDANVVTDIEK
jgi:hypothetical protein